MDSPTRFPPCMCRRVDGSPLLQPSAAGGGSGRAWRGGRKEAPRGEGRNKDDQKIYLGLFFQWTFFKKTFSFWFKRNAILDMRWFGHIIKRIIGFLNTFLINKMFYQKIYILTLYSLLSMFPSPCSMYWTGLADKRQLTDCLKWRRLVDIMLKLVLRFLQKTIWEPARAAFSRLVWTWILPSLTGTFSMLYLVIC